MGSRRRVSLPSPGTPRLERSQLLTSFTRLGILEESNRRKRGRRTVEAALAWLLR